MIAGVHQKVFTAVCEKWQKEDDRLVSHCQKLTGLTADLLGVSNYFACPLPSAVSVNQSARKNDTLSFLLSDVDRAHC